MKAEWVLILNSAAGQRARGIKDVLSACRQAGIKPRLVEPATPAATTKTAWAWRNKRAVVVVLGGDGTLNLAGAALAGGRAVLAPLPGGTENVLCRELGLPLDPGRAMGSLARGQARPWDLGLFGGRPFLLMAGAGLDGEVALRAVGAWKRAMGRGAFVLSALAAFVRSRFSFSAVLDGKRMGPCWQMVISNASRYGAGLPFSPDARPDDGILDASWFLQAGLTGRLVQSASVPNVLHNSPVRRSQTRSARSLESVATCSPSADSSAP